MPSLPFECPPASPLGGSWRYQGLVLICALSTACAAPASGAASPAPEAAPTSAAPLESRWESLLDRGHPLVGRIWDVGRQRFIEATVLAEQVRRSRFVAIGEQHDNVDHHRLEALLLDAVSDTRHPAVVFEMLDIEKQSAVDAAATASPGDPDALADAVDWRRSGWPPFSLYRPIFAVAATRRLSVVAGGVDRFAAHRIAHAGLSALPPEMVRRFGLSLPLDANAERGLRDEMRDAHCGMLPESMLDAMALIQRVRDAELALEVSSSDAGQGAVLIAGNGHVRNDRGAPRTFARGTGESLLSVALIEVRGEWTEPRAYAAEFAANTLPFDYVWFTPRASDEDHCAELRAKP